VHTATYLRYNLVESSLMSGTYLHLQEVLQGHEQMVDLCEAMKCQYCAQKNC
jgi:hypothetical protein